MISNNQPPTNLIQQALSIIDHIDHYHPIHPATSQPPSSTNPLTSTPALEQLRSLVRKRNTKPLNTLGSSKKSSSDLHREAAYNKPLNHGIAPNSQADFLNRLKTFTLTTYPAGKPNSLSPPTMARFGWINVEKNRLKCQTCLSSWVLAVPTDLDWRSTSGTQLEELGKRTRIERHRPSCSWRNRQSPRSIYQPPHSKNCRDTIKTLIETARVISDSFFTCESQSPFRVEHSLPEQALTALSIVLQSENQQDSMDQSLASLTIEPLILALFGWSARSLLEPAPGSTQSLPTSPSLLKTSTSNFSPSTKTSTTEPRAEQKVLSCKLCHRQILPSKGHQKTFNPIIEHRDYCPFVDESCGFEEKEHVQEFQPKNNTGWKDNLEMVEKFIYRMNQPSHHHDENLDKSKFFTLENIVNQFSSSQSNHHHYTSNQDPSFVGHSDSSPQITLLNFVKAVLTVPPPSKLQYT